MKLKRFENWVSDITDKSINVNYGDKPKIISRFITLIENYIEEHFENISKIDLFHLSVVFDKIDYEEIIVNKQLSGDYYKYDITTVKRNVGRGKYREIDISEDDYKHISNFIFNIDKKYIKKNQKKDLDDILSDIDPVLKNAKNYNL